MQREAPEAYTARALEPGRIRAENLAQRFVTDLDRAGALVSSDAEPWSLSMRATAIGCEGSMSPLAEAEPEAEGNRVRYRHEGSVEAWYLNGPLGLEQGFVVPAAPSCSGTKVVTLDLDGDLRAALDDPDGDGRGGVSPPARRRRPPRARVHRPVREGRPRQGAACLALGGRGAALHSRRRRGSRVSPGDRSPDRALQGRHR
ncbi:hypothetical protein [Chondromyces apiculatus]|uniref:hypothetical protein n=1 Tax=Chondromyces apiculatus TaxID=51 RepID=UPI001E2CDB97|nr:hypothetical protein [Chondromyces apiculatus]